MVKIQDGSLVPASQLLSGEAEDPDVEGGKIKFQQAKDSIIPTYTAKAKMNDGSGRSRTYTFSIEDTNVVVHIAQSTEEEKTTVTTEKSVKEVSPSSSTTDTKKNISSSEDYRVKKHF